MTDDSPEATASTDDCCATNREDTQSSKNGRTLKQIYCELVGHPFFPLLFISEAIKNAVMGTPYVPEFAILAVISTVMWAVSDKVEVDVNLTDNGIIK